MINIDELKARIEGLEADLRYKDDQIRELRQENSQAVDLVDEMREHVEGANELIESWIEAFGMEMGESGMYDFGRDLLLDQHSKLIEKHNKLLREWNKFVGEYNSTIAPRDLGRPLQASEAQVKDVRKLRKAKTSLRTIAEQTGLSLRTVRTIVGKDAGTDRTGKRVNLLRKREINRLRAAEYRAQKRTRDQLPKRITETRKRGEDLVKAAKGLGD
jgi:cell division septum initiation protein DivIVA